MAEYIFRDKDGNTVFWATDPMEPDSKWAEEVAQKNGAATVEVR